MKQRKLWKHWPCSPTWKQTPGVELSSPHPFGQVIDSLLCRSYHQPLLSLALRLSVTIHNPPWTIVFLKGFFFKIISLFLRLSETRGSSRELCVSRTIGENMLVEVKIIPMYLICKQVHWLLLFLHCHCPVPAGIWLSDPWIQLRGEGGTLPHRQLVGKPLAEPGAPRCNKLASWAPWGWSGLVSVSSLMNELNGSQQGKLLPSGFPLTTTLSFLQLNNGVCFCVLFCGIGRWRFYIRGDTDLLQFEVRFPLYLVSVSSRHGRQPRVEWKLDVSGSFPVDDVKCVCHFATSWTIQSMEFSRPEY